MEKLISNMESLCGSIKTYVSKNNISSNIVSAETGISIDVIKRIKRGQTVVITPEEYIKVKTFMKASDKIFGIEPKDRVELFYYYLYIHGTDSKAFEDVTGIKAKDMETYIQEHKLYSKKSDICKMLTEKEYNKISNTLPVILPEKKNYKIIKGITRASLLDLFLDKSKKTIEKVAKEANLSIGACQHVFEGAPCNDDILERIAKAVGTNLKTLNSDPYNLMGENNMIGYFIIVEIQKCVSNIYSYAHRVSMNYNTLKSIISGSTCITAKDIETIFSRIDRYDIDELTIKLARPVPLKAVDPIDVLKAAVDKTNNFAKSARELNTSTYVLNAVINGKKEISEIDHDKLIKFCGTEINKFDIPEDNQEKLVKTRSVINRISYDGTNFIKNINNILNNTGLSMNSIYNEMKKKHGAGFQLNYVISGKIKYITIRQLKLLADFLGYTPDELLFGEISISELAKKYTKKQTKKQDEKCTNISYRITDIIINNLKNMDNALYIYKYTRAFTEDIYSYEKVLNNKTHRIHGVSVNKICEFWGITPEEFVNSEIDFSTIAAKKFIPVPTPTNDKIDPKWEELAEKIEEKAEKNAVKVVEEEKNLTGVKSEEKEVMEENIEVSNSGKLVASEAVPISISDPLPELIGRVDELENKVYNMTELEEICQNDETEEMELIKHSDHLVTFFEGVKKMNVEEQIALIKILDSNAKIHPDAYNNNVLGRVLRYNIIYSLVATK